MTGFFDIYADLKRKPQSPQAPPPGSSESDAESPLEGSIAKPMSVTELTRQIKSSLRSAFPTVLIQGEISNYGGPHHSGHSYFKLKDAGAIIEVVLWKTESRGLKFELTDGMEVIVRGRLDVFERSGKYQVAISTITPVGTGALELAYRQLYARLEAEGLFAAERKRPIPKYPRTIALVTSKAAAGLQDQLKVLRRFPFLRLLVVHVPVQGEGAAARIAKALDGVNEHAASLGGIDLILLGRGGGSFEDLFEFSREDVARAVHRSVIPVITGIGHEVDVAIADLVADHHAHTPTEAATFAVRYWKQAAELLDGAASVLRRDVRTRLQQASQRLLHVERSNLFQHPEELITRRQQRLDDRGQRLLMAARELLRRRRLRLDALEKQLSQFDPRRVLLQRRDRLFKISMRLEAAQAHRFRRLEARLATAEARLQRSGPQQRLATTAMRLTAVQDRLSRAVMSVLWARGERLQSLSTQLRVLGPESVLARGFSITRRADTGEVVRSADELNPGDELSTRLAGGEVRSKVLPPPGEAG